MHIRKTFPTLILLALTFSPFGVWGASAQQVLSVQVRKTVLRATPEMWASVVGDLNYGDSLTVDSGGDAKEGWLKVTDIHHRAGFVHMSAVTSKKVVLSPSAAKQAQADPADVVLAGKGFSKEVEAQYAKSQGLDFTQVNAVEKLNVSSAQLARFIKEGKLGGGK